MARCLQIRRGTTAEHATFKGAVAELSVSTDDSRLRIHDGVKAGGHPVVLREDLATNSDYGIVRFATLEELAKSEDADGLDTVVVSAKDLKKFCRETSLSAMPIGTMIFYLGKTIPEGWLLANGSTYDTTLYPDLYAVLGTNTLPNMHHRFIEGTTTLSEVGSYIAAGLPNITANFNPFIARSVGNTIGAFSSNQIGNSGIAGGSGTCIDRGLTFNAKTANALYRDDCNEVRVNALFGLSLIRAY